MSISSAKKTILTAIGAILIVSMIGATSAFAEKDGDKNDSEKNPFTIILAEIKQLQDQIAKLQGGNTAHTRTMWIDHLDFLPGDSSVSTSFNAVNSGVGGGLSGLIIQSSTLGDTAKGGGNKVVETALEIPPANNVTGVTICYEGTNSSRTFVDQVRIAQVQNPPSTAIVRLDDPTHLTASGPTCVNSQPTLINPNDGALLLSLRINAGDTSDKIVLRSVGITLNGIP
jgi:hypothetical protein